MIARMWCLVSQANSVILEVQVDPKAIGQECLEKVSAYFCLCQHIGLVIYIYQPWKFISIFILSYVRIVFDINMYKHEVKF